MIPGPLFSLPMLLLLLAPWLSLALTLWLLLNGLAWWIRHRNISVEQRRKFWRWPTISMTALAAAGNLWGVVLWYQFDQSATRATLQQHYRESRQNFVLPQDFHHGELMVPRGSLINRYDPFDNGEAQRPLRLRGLDKARFPHPIQIAGVWAAALEAEAGHIELARDQRIGPVLRFDHEAQDGYGEWVIDPSRAYLECKKGQIAKFDKPMIDYDIVAEFGRPAPDGPNARFRPSQWRVMSCDDDGPIPLRPPYDQAGPKGANATVWEPQPPSQH